MVQLNIKNFAHNLHGIVYILQIYLLYIADGTIAHYMSIKNLGVNHC